MKAFQGLRLSDLVLIAGLLLAACAPQATPTPAAAPTQAPTATSAPTTAPEPTKAPEATATTAPAADKPTETPAASAEKPAAPAGGTRYDLVEGKTSASYSVREQLAGRDLPNDAVGKTSKVSGAIVLNPDGSVDSKNSQIVVDAASLQTDESRRDNYVRNNILLTSQFKEIVFVPTAVEGLPSPIPASGPLNFKLIGDLTIKDVTKQVTWEVTGTVNGDAAEGVATTSFKFAEFNLKQPQVPIVLSLVDNITLTVELALQKAK